VNSLDDAGGDLRLGLLKSFPVRVVVENFVNGGGEVVAAERFGEEMNGVVVDSAVDEGISCVAGHEEDF